MSLRATVILGLRWTLGVRVMAQAVTWVITLFVIRILTPTDYGLVAMASVFVAFVSIVSEIGLGPAIVQRRNVDEPTLAKLFGTIILIHAALVTLLMMAAPIVAAFYGEPRVSPVVRVLSLQLLIAAFGVVPDALLQRDMNFRQRSLIDLSGAVAGAVLTLGLALAQQGVWSLVAGSLLTQAWKVVGVNVVSPFPRWPRFSFTGLRSFVTFGGNLTASQILWWFYSQADVMIAGKWLGKELLGFYSVAMHVASLPNQRLAGIINNVAFPAFSRVQHDLRALGANVLLGVRVLSLTAFAIFWGMSSVAPELVSVFLGPTWDPAVLPLQILAFIMPLRTIGNFIPNAVQAVGRSDILLKNAIVLALIGPSAFVVGVHWGLVGLCVAWLVATPLIFVQNTVRAVSAIEIRFGQIAKAMWPPAVCAAVMYATVVASRLVLSQQGAVVRLLILVTIGAVIYIGVSLVVNRDGLREARDIWSELIPIRRARLDSPK